MPATLCLGNARTQSLPAASMCPDWPPHPTTPHHTPILLYPRVCSDDGIGPREVRVACRQLGFSYGQMLGGPDIGLGGVPPPGRDFWMDNVNCGGSPTFDRLTQCTYSGWGRNDCVPEQEALAVMCGEDPRLIVSPPPPSPSPPPPSPFACECARRACRLSHMYR